MYHGNPQLNREERFWKTYFITLACVLATGLVPSLVLVNKHGYRIFLPGHLREESISDVLAEEWILCPNCMTTITGTEKGEIFLELATSDSPKEAVLYYKEQFDQRGYSYSIEKDNLGTVITAEKGKVSCKVRVSSDEYSRTRVEIILSRPKP
jgi:uncharacterized protein YciU (UPF0263 family)